MSDTSNLEIPVIIINWKGIEDTLECMDSVLQLSYPHYKIYLVDNYSNDGSKAILKEQFQSNPKVKLILNQENLGFTKANNEIFDLILSQKNKPKYIALLNNDTVVKPDWLSNLVACAQGSSASIVASKMINYYDRKLMDNAGHRMLNTGEILPIGHGDPTDLYNVSKENMGACAGACLYRVSMLEDIGIFDEYFNTGYEDAELGLRATLAGYKCLFEPTAIVYHKMGNSIGKVFNYKYALTIQKNILYTYFKLMPLSNILISIPFIFIRYFLMSLTYLFFRKWKYLKILKESLQDFFTKDLKAIRQVRQLYISNNLKLSTWKISQKLTFFIIPDIDRFLRIFVKKEKSALDSYGKTN